ncbi:MAG: CdaR family protein [Bacillota bacterium]|nr:CdaR family protein [Bacillota bacterium]
MKGIWDKDLNIRIISGLIAIVLWIYVGYQNPETESVFRDIPVTVTLPASNNSMMGALSVITGGSYKVDVTVSGKRSVIRSLKESDIVATVDATNIKDSGVYELPVNVECSRSDVLIMRKSPTNIKVRLDHILTAEIPVKVNMESKLSGSDYIFDNTKYEPESIKVTGPSEDVTAIKNAIVTCTIDKPDSLVTQKLGFTFCDSNGSAIRDDYLNSDTNEVKVTTSVLKKKTVPLAITLNGNISGDARALFPYTIDPASVTIAGAESVVNSIDSIPIGSIDVSKITENTDQTFGISVPSNVKLMDNVTKAKVTITPGDLTTRIIDVSDVNITGLPDGYAATLLTKPVEVKIRGANNVVSAVSSADIKASIVFSSNEQVSTGTYEMPVKIEILNSKAIGVIGDVTAKVSIDKTAPPAVS